jgi:hypothetical protein
MVAIGMLARSHPEASELIHGLNIMPTLLGYLGIGEGQHIETLLRTVWLVTVLYGPGLPKERS